MRKFGVFAATVFICQLLAGVYGILHDQVTYSISPEYFTKFKYIQFGFGPSDFGGHRQTVAVIGFLATWWTGTFIGLGLGLTGLIFGDFRIMRKSISKAVFLVFCTAALAGLLGFLYGKYYLATTGVNWWIPDDTIDRKNFIVVGSIHNSSYLGGLVGLMAGIVYLIRQKIKSI
ncbi:MAG: hypothetical protein HZA79_07925 [Sphingobacteriales bacterium]|nr:hypothetical protein [Sphingobacteriales bacterium]